jgi:uncharacterized membrane protein
MLIYYALSGLVSNYFNSNIGLHPMLIYYALSGLVSNYFNSNIGLHPILIYYVLSGLVSELIGVRNHFLKIKQYET